MKVQEYKINGEPVSIHAVEHEEDLDEFEEWLHRAMVRGPIGFDTETSGLRTYSGDTLRLVQFGDAFDGWVIPFEDSPWTHHVIQRSLRMIPVLVAHNASFDIQVAEKHLGIPMEELWPKVRDTRILAHLCDPRGKDEGGTGHSLEDLLAQYVSKDAAREVKQLMTKLAREHKVLKKDIFREIPLDHPHFLMYSGADAIFAVRLFLQLDAHIPAESRHLVAYEHELAAVASFTERNGFLVDQDYSKALSHRLQAEENEALWHLDTFFDLQTANAVQQIAEVLEEEFGYHTEKDCPLLLHTPEYVSHGGPLPHLTLTSKGNIQVDKRLLEDLAQSEPVVGSVSHLSNAIIEAKRARKWRTTWVDHFLSGADDSGRVHASINPLRARTARWSITGIPAQTLPSGDWLIRRCFVADPGHRMVSVDYDAQELRVLAALSQDEVMMQAFKDNKDLHQMTADAAGVPRKVGKMANFLKVYGGGVNKLTASADIPEEVASNVIRTFSKTYPGVTAYGRYLQQLATEQGFVTTPLGRVLPVDEDRPYAALNYMVQSTSRDITCRGVLNLHKAGFTPYLRLVIHDEVLLSLPEDGAESMTEEIAEHMGASFRGVNISASGEIGRKSWGSLYSCYVSEDCGLSKGHKGSCTPTGWSSAWKA